MSTVMVLCEKILLVTVSLIEFFVVPLDTVAVVKVMLPSRKRDTLELSLAKNVFMEQTSMSVEGKSLI